VKLDWTAVLLVSVFCEDETSMPGYECAAENREKDCFAGSLFTRFCHGKASFRKGFGEVDGARSQRDRNAACRLGIRRVRAAAGRGRSISDAGTSPSRFRAKAAFSKMVFVCRRRVARGAGTDYGFYGSAPDFSLAGNVLCDSGFAGGSFGNYRDCDAGG
jgi:hypothetical protein